MKASEFIGAALLAAFVLGLMPGSGAADPRIPGRDSYDVTDQNPSWADACRSGWRNSEAYNSCTARGTVRVDMTRTCTVSADCKTGAGGTAIANHRGKASDLRSLRNCDGKLLRTACPPPPAAAGTAAPPRPRRHQGEADRFGLPDAQRSVCRRMAQRALRHSPQLLERRSRLHRAPDLGTAGLRAPVQGHRHLPHVRDDRRAGQAGQRPHHVGDGQTVGHSQHPGVRRGIDGRRVPGRHGRHRPAVRRSRRLSPAPRKRRRPSPVAPRRATIPHSSAREPTQPPTRGLRGRCIRLLTSANSRIV